MALLGPTVDVSPSAAIAISATVDVSPVIAGAATVETAAGEVAVAVARVSAVGRIAVEIAPIDLPAAVPAATCALEQVRDHRQRPTTQMARGTAARGTRLAALRLTALVIRHTALRTTCRATRRGAWRTDRTADWAATASPVLRVAQRPRAKGSVHLRVEDAASRTAGKQNRCYAKENHSSHRFDFS